jgi:aromatic amino acid aminotransferase I / 2-aminoadipate transaminase
MTNIRFYIKMKRQPSLNEGASRNVNYPTYTFWGERNLLPAMLKMPRRSHIKRVQTLRVHQKPILATDAPHTDSNDFKSAEAFTKPQAKRWDHRLSLESSARNGSTLKGFAASMGKGELITLGTARPTAEVFPWNSVDFHGLELSSSTQLDQTTTTGQASMTAEKYDDMFGLGVALNYGPAAGSAQLVRFFTEHVEIFHNPPYSDWECSATCGNTSALEIAFRTFCSRGDYVLCEENTYSGAVEALRPLGVNIKAVRMDDDGLLPGDLDNILQNWDVSRGRKPFILYMIPTGHNPTGSSQPAARRKHIYKVAEKHDLYIIEDDPYYLIQLGSYQGQTNDKGDCISIDSDVLMHLPPSYLSLDTSGRVLRLDSTSKILAPGLRCGWMTASSQIIQKMVCHHEVAIVAPSGVSQIMLYKLLDETWGHEGFIAWLVNLSSKYRARRDALLVACEKFLPSEICSWKAPNAGMFLWVKIDWKKHPVVGIVDGDQEQAKKQILDIENKLFNQAIKNEVMVNKGSWFRAEKGNVWELAFRLTSAAAPEKDLAEAARRFGEAIKIEFELN